MSPSSLCVTLESIFPPLGKKKGNHKGENCLLTLDDGMKLVQMHGNVFEAEETMGLKYSKWPQRQ